MEMNVISETEYSFSNALFWNVMLHHHIRAFDEERDANFDEVWDEELVPALLDEKKYKNIGVGYLKLNWKHPKIKVK